MKDKTNQNITTTTTTSQMEKLMAEWHIEASDMANNTFNPIRNILESMKVKPNKHKKMISLSIGDPTTFGNLKPSEVTMSAILESVQSGKYNGYGPSSGFVEAREAVAEHVSTIGNEITAEDVIICSGCSCALDMCISALGNPGDNILVPRPGFPLYKTLANGLGIETREYDLLPEKGWEVDCKHMESLIDDKTVAIVVNNPSNPCGSVFSESHLLEILAVAEKYRLPIIADEIYEHFVFESSGKRYVPMASLTNQVPILSCGGLTKRYLVPGWRLGWITIHDRNNLFTQGGVRSGLNKLSQRIIGANTLVQGALPTILKKTPQSFYQNTLKIIEDNARYAFKRLSAIEGLTPVMPDGAMYMMVGLDPKAFPTFRDDLAIVEGLVAEQSVFCLPGKCFNVKDFVRVVLTVPHEMLEEACNRIAEFCEAHHPVSYAGHRLEMLGLKLKETPMQTTPSGSSSSAVSSEDESGSGASTPTLPKKKHVFCKSESHYDLIPQEKNPSRVA